MTTPSSDIARGGRGLVVSCPDPTPKKGWPAVGSRGLAAGRSRLIDRARKGSGGAGQLSREHMVKVAVVTPSIVPLNMSDIQQDSSEPSAPIMIKLFP